MSVYDVGFLTDMIATFPFSINEVFSTYKSSFKINSSFVEYVDDLLDETFNASKAGTTTEVIVKKLKKSLSNKRNYLYTSMKSALELPLENTSNPYNYILTMPEKKKMATFQTCDNKEIVENLLKDIDIWNEDKRTMLIDFPLYDELRMTRKKDCFSTDVVISCWDYIEKKFNGNINGSNIYALTGLLGLSEFPNKKYTNRYPANTQISFTFEKVADDGVYTLKILDAEEDIEPVLSSDIIRMRDYLVHLVESDYEVLKVKRTLSIKLDDCCRILTTDTIREKHRARARKAWRYVRHIDLQFRTPDTVPVGKGYVERNNYLISGLHFYQKDNGIEFVDIELTDYLLDQVFAKNYVAVKSIQYELLDNPLAKVLFHSLVYSKGREVANEHGYIYLHVTFFLSNADFTGTLRENIVSIKDALNEFVNKEILVSDFYLMDGDYFAIKFI